MNLFQKKSSNRFIIVGLGILLLALGVFWIKNRHVSGEQAATIISRDAGVQHMLSLTTNDYTLYTHPVYGFSFRYPKDFILSDYPDGQQEIVLVESPRYNMGFQIFIQPFDETGPITKERILKDVPTLDMQDVVEFFISGNVPAIRFSSKDPQLGSLREIWFSHNRILYQISMRSPDQEWLDSWIRELANDFTFNSPPAE